jgi:hypothetical protein
LEDASYVVVRRVEEREGEGEHGEGEGGGEQQQPGGRGGGNRGEREKERERESDGGGERKREGKREEEEGGKEGRERAKRDEGRERRGERGGKREEGREGSPRRAHPCASRGLFPPTPSARLAPREAGGGGGYAAGSDWPWDRGGSKACHENSLGLGSWVLGRSSMCQCMHTHPIQRPCKPPHRRFTAVTTEFIRARPQRRPGQGEKELPKRKPSRGSQGVYGIYPTD